MLTIVPDPDAGDNARPTSSSPALIDEIVREGARRMLAEALQAEVEDYIAAFGDERDENGRRRRPLDVPSTASQTGDLRPREIVHAWRGGVARRRRWPPQRRHCPALAGAPGLRRRDRTRGANRKAPYVAVPRAAPRPPISSVKPGARAQEPTHRRRRGAGGRGGGFVMPGSLLTGRGARPHDRAPPRD